MAAKTTDWRPGPTVCRCCLSEGCYKDISTEYFWMGKREVYAEMLSETLNLSIAYSTSGGPNSNSRLICEPCISRLRDASDFKRQVQECEKTFMQYLDPGSEPLSDFDETRIEVPIEQQETQVKVEAVKTEKDDASDGDGFDDRADFLDDDDDDLDDQPLTRLATKVPKKESVDLLDLLAETKPAEKRKATTKAKAGPAKKAKTKKEVVKATSSKATKQTEKKKKGNPNANGGDSTIDTGSVVMPKIGVLKKAEQKKQCMNSAIDFIHSTNICPFQFISGRFNCIYCSTRYSTISELEEHVEQEHKGVTEKDTAKAIHALGRYKYDPVKVNVLNFICKLCDEDLRKFEDLKQHLIVKHNKRTLVDNDGILPYMMLYDDFSCVLCEEKFVSYYKLTKHVNSHYPTFMCDHCGAGFASKARLIGHRIYHDSGLTYPCEECPKVFKNLASKSKHVNKMHKNKTQIFKCPFCEETFKSHYRREKHQQSVHGKQKKKYDVKCKFCHKLFSDIAACKQHENLSHLLAQQYTCDICGFKTIYKDTMRHHIMYTHSTEKNFKCEVCKKSYARRKTLVQHMKKHTNDKKFVCPYCAKAFVQNGSLKTHVQTQHERDTLGKKS